ncbi:hypothetical protein BC01_136 [Bacillus phage BC01]|nr:hypothetical protein BC01_136 [Bacillus phage BC01]
MDILSSRKQEIIQVLHNSIEELRETVSMLKKDGWSGNTLTTVTGSSVCRRELYTGDMEWISNNYPGVTIHPPEEGNYLRTRPYVFITEHVRDIEEE